MDFINARRLFLLCAVTGLIFMTSTRVRATIDRDPEASFAPEFEGIYAIRLECRESPPSQPCKDMEFQTRMVILNVGPQTGSANEIVINIINPEVEVTLYEFAATHFANSGAVITAKNRGMGGKQAEIYVEINPSDKKVLAYLRDSEFDADLRITGSQTISPSSLYHTVSEPLTSPQIQGKYWVNQDSLLSVRLTLTGSPTFFATLTTHVGAKIYFDVGEFSPETGVLTLINSHSLLKWILAIEKDSKDMLQVHGLSLMGASGYSRPLVGTSVSKMVE